MKEQLLWMRTFHTLEELHDALRAFRIWYNANWLIQRHDHRTPGQVRGDQHDEGMALSSQGPQGVGQNLAALVSGGRGVSPAGGAVSKIAGHRWQPDGHYAVSNIRYRPDCALTAWVTSEWYSKRPAARVEMVPILETDSLRRPVQSSSKSRQELAQAGMTVQQTSYFYQGMQHKVRPLRGKAVLRAGVIATDLVSVLLAAAGAEWLQYAESRVAEPAWPALVVTLVCAYAVYVGLGVSDVRRVRHPRIALLAIVYWTLAFIAAAGGALLLSAEPSRTLTNLALWYPTSALGLMAWRSLALRLAERVALVVTHEKADGVAWGDRIPAAVVRKAEVVATTMPGGLSGDWSGRVLNSAHELAWRCDERAVDRILVVAPDVLGEQLLKRLLPLSACAVQVDVLANSHDPETTRCPAASFHSLSVVRLLQPRLGEVHRFVKLAEDIVLALLAIAAFALVLFAVAAAVKLSSPGPVMFRPRWHTFNHANFEVWKFRTLSPADRLSEVRQATRDAKRVQSVGRILQGTSLDKLPHVFNVLLGKMSMVGPRPDAIEHNMIYGQLIDRYMQRHRIKPGITGWAQGKGLRGEIEDFAKMQVRVDCDIENWSILLDLRRCLMTLSVLSHRNACWEDFGMGPGAISIAVRAPLVRTFVSGVRK